MTRAAFPISAYEQPSIAAARLLEGNLGAATRALVEPTSLDPADLKRLKDKLGSGGKHHPVVETLLDISTNPIFLIGMGLSLWRPVRSIKSLQALQKTAAESYRKHAPILSSLRSPQQLLVGYPKVWKNMLNTWLTTLSINNAYQKRLEAGVLAFQKKTGRMPTAKDWYLVTSKQAGLDRMDGWDVRGMKQAGIDVTEPPLKTITFDATPVGRGRQALFEHSKDAVENVWKTIESRVKDPKARERLMAAMESRKFSFREQVQREEAGKTVTPGGYIRHYYPRMQLLRRGQRIDYLEGVVSGENARQTYTERVLRGATQVVAGSHIKREGGMAMMPDYVGLEKVIPEYINRNTMSKVQNFGKEYRLKQLETIQNVIVSGKAGGALPKTMENRMRSAFLSQGLPIRQANAMANEIANQIRGRGSSVKDLMATAERALDWKGNIPVYTLDPSSLQKYGHTMSQELAWTLDGRGKEIVEGVKNISDKALRSTMETNYIPLLRGMRPFNQVAQSLSWHQNVMGASEWFQKNEKFFGPKLTKWVTDKLTAPQALGSPGLGTSLTQYFYMSTMGFNLGPPSKNLMQPVISLYPLVGAGPTWGGFKDTVKNIAEYSRLRFDKGLAPAEAKARAFKDFYKTFPQESAPLAASMARGDISGEYRPSSTPLTGAGGSLSSVWERLRRYGLAVFSKSEEWNRMWSFYAGRRYAQESGIPMAERNVAAAEVVGATQFPAGPLGMPPVLLKIPGLLRQFMYFPTRYAGFLATPKEQGGGLGMLGRVGMGSVAAWAGAKNLLGVNLDPSLALGALPLPTYEGSPFYPWPLVPPAVGVAGHMAKAAFGDPERRGTELSQMASLLTPAGIGIRRMYRLTAPKYVDYENPSPEGRYTVFNNSKLPVGQFTSTELWMKRLGLNPTGMTGEREFTQYLIAQRNRIRGVRAEYMSALADNDTPRAEEIQDQWKKQFPSLGPLTVRDQDIKALMERRNMSRVQRILRGFPSKHRDVYAQHAATLQGSLMSNSIMSGGN